MDIEIQIKIPTDRISDLLINAINGGINYWCSECSSNEDVSKLKSEPDTFTEDEEGKVHTLTYEKMIAGLRLMAEKYPGHFGDFMSHNDDASTADVFIQLCLFKDVVYG